MGTTLVEVCLSDINAEHCLKVTVFMHICIRAVACIQKGLWTPAQMFVLLHCIIQLSGWRACMLLLSAQTVRFKWCVHEPIIRQEHCHSCPEAWQSGALRKCLSL